MNNTKDLITDEQLLVGATSRFDHDIPVYDDGFGQLWIARSSIHTYGIIRARSLEDAYGIWEDEFADEASETHEDFVREYGENYLDDASWNESFGIRPNGPNKVGGSCIYQKDLNGDYLYELTPKLIDELGITLQTEEWE
jgi:hypothetical protein